ncbi:MAG: DUF6597 domain-containing transcriptional factor [Leadbetterella sp.]
MFQSFRPPPHLADYIDTFWSFESKRNHQNSLIFHAVAGCKIELIFYLDGNFKQKDAKGNINDAYRAGVYGQSTCFGYYYPTTDYSSVFGVSLHPIFLTKLLKIPADEITNQIVSISDVLGNGVKDLIDKILASTSPEERINIVTEFFENKISRMNSKNLIFEKLIKDLQFSNTQFSVQDLLKQTSVSQRQFERNFKETTGFSAKTYLKVNRFEQLIKTVSNPHYFKNNSYLDVALDFGYYDHSHLNHHFKEFTGLNPSTYFHNLITQNHQM